MASDLTKSKKQSRLSQTVFPLLTLFPLAKSNMVSKILKNADMKEQAMTDPKCLVM